MYAMSDGHPGSPEEARDVIADVREKERQVIENPHDRTRDRVQGLQDRAVEGLDNPSQVIPELLQNADDITQCSSVVIEVTDEHLRFKNDGRPMKKKEVDALCALEKSTKQALEFIGYFGRGFKACFSISDNPQVHSGYFRFEFFRDRPTLPELVDDGEEFLEGTEIVLPFSEDLDQEDLDRLHERIDEIHALLPYLRNVDHIELLRQGERKVYDREETDDGIVVIRENGDVLERRNAFTIHESLPEEELAHLKEKRGLKDVNLEEDEETLSITISFPVDENGVPQSRSGTRLFCYFPTEVETRLPFDIQADFLLDTTRRHLNRKDDKVNQWILNKVYEAYKEVYRYYIDRDTPRFDFIQLIPDNDSVPEFLKHIQKDILDFLAGEDCIQCKDGQLHLPNNVVILDDRIAPYISQQELQEVWPDPVHLPADIVGEDNIKKLYNLDLITKIGVEEFLEACVGEEIFTEKGSEQLIEFLAALNQYWEDNYKGYLRGREKRKNRDAFKETVQQVALLPLEEQHVRAFDDVDKEIFVPPSRTEKYDIFKDKIAFIDEAITDDAESEDEDTPTEEARSFLKDVFDITELRDQSVIKQIVNPAFDQSDDRDPAVLDTYLLFLFRNENRWKYADGIKLRSVSETDSSPEYARPRELYLSDAYGRQYSLETILAGVETVDFVSPEYLELTDDEDTERWADFLTRLRVKEKIRVTGESKNSRKTFRSKEVLRSYLEEQGDEGTDIVESQKHTGDTEDTWLSGYKYGVKDWTLDQPIRDWLETCIENGQDTVFEHFVRMLDQHWEYYQERLYRRYYHVVQPSNAYEAEEEATNCPSSFGQFLLHEPWYPASNGELAVPRTLFIRNEFTRNQVEGRFIGVEPDHDEIIEELNIQTRLGIDATLDILQNAKTSINEEDPSAIRRRIRRYLDTVVEHLQSAEDAEQERIVDALQDAPFIYVDRASPAFRRPAEVFWEGKRSIGEALVPIKDEYGDYEDLFLEHLNITARVGLADLVSYVIDHGRRGEYEAVSDIWPRLIQGMVRELDELGNEGFKQSEVVQRFIDKGVVPTANDALAPISDIAYYCVSEKVLERITDAGVTDQIVLPIDSRRVSNADFRGLMEAFEFTDLESELQTEVVDRLQREEHITDQGRTEWETVNQILEVAYSYLDQMESRGTERIRQISEYDLYTVQGLACYYTLNGKAVSDEFTPKSHLDHGNQQILITSEKQSFYALATCVAEDNEVSDRVRAELTDLLKGAIGTRREFLPAFLDDRGLEYQSGMKPPEVAPSQEAPEGVAADDITEDDDAKTADEEEATPDVGEVDANPTEEKDGQAPTPSIGGAQGNVGTSHGGTSTGSTGTQLTAEGSEAEESEGGDEEQNEAKAEEKSRDMVEVMPDEVAEQGLNRPPTQDKKRGTGGGGSGGVRSRTGGSDQDGENDRIGRWGEELVMHLLVDAVETYFRDRGELEDTEWRWQSDLEQTDVTGDEADDGFYRERIQERVPGVRVDGALDGEDFRITILDISEHETGGDIVVEGAAFLEKEREFPLAVSDMGSELETTIEVKTSPGHSRSFELTRAQYKRAFEEEERYHVVRICNAESEEAYIDTVLTNIPDLETDGTVEIEGWKFTVKYQ